MTFYHWTVIQTPSASGLFLKKIKFVCLDQFTKLLSMKDDQDSSDWKTENGSEPVFFLFCFVLFLFFMAKLRLNNELKSIDKVLSN